MQGRLTLLTLLRGNSEGDPGSSRLGVGSMDGRGLGVYEAKLDGFVVY